MDLGWFETSLDVQDIVKSVAFYETLGFRHVEGDIAVRTVTLNRGDCRLTLFQGHLDPARTQLIFWQGDVEAIAREATAKGIRLSTRPERQQGRRERDAVRSGRPSAFLHQHAGSFHQ